MVRVGREGTKGLEPRVTPTVRRLVEEVSRGICQGASYELRARGVSLKPSEGDVLGLEPYNVKSFVYQTEDTLIHFLERKSE